MTSNVVLVVDPTLSYAKSIFQTANTDIQKSIPPISPDYTFKILIDGDSSCSGPTSCGGVANLSSLYYTQGVQAVFGPTCFQDLEISARLTNAWDIVQFNFWSDHPSDYMVNNIVQMTTTSTYNIGNNIMAVLKGAKWSKVAIIKCASCYGDVDVDIQETRLLNITQVLTTNGVEILVSIDIQPSWNVDKLVNVTSQLGYEARVIIPFLGSELADYVTFMQSMNVSGYTSDEFTTLITLTDYSVSGVQLPWVDQNSPVIQSYFENVIVLYNDNFDMSRTQLFIERTSLSSDQDNLLVYLQLYESFFVYANFMHVRFLENPNITSSNVSGSALRKTMSEYPAGPFGPIYFNVNTLRVAPYTLAIINDTGFNMLTKIGIDRTCANGICMLLNMSQTGIMPNMDMPVCGFKGELCDQTGTVIIIGVVLVLIVGSMVMFVLARKMKTGESSSMPWSIPMPAVKILDLDTNVGSQQMSMHSLQQHIETKEKMRETSRQLATLDQGYVIVESYSIKNRIQFDRSELQMLFNMKQLSHDNINTFIGLSFDKSTNFYILFAHCFRGSLADLVMKKDGDNTSFTFDDNFRGAFVRDILKGLDFLHSSAIGYHGSLTPSNCLIDSHWILKISGYGISRMIYKWKNSSILATNDGRPIIPNGELHYYAPEIRRLLKASMYTNRLETLNVDKKAGQSADMYGFGMVLFEIVFRKKLVDIDEQYQEENVILCEQAEAQVPLYPTLPDASDVHPDLLGLMHKCWTGQVDQRPDATLARKITDATIKISGSLVDQMIKNMERYTNGLQSLVKERTGQLEEEQKKADELLSELLPPSIAEELKVGRRVDAKVYKSVTVLYSDIVGFTSLSSESAPMEVVAMLSGMFQKFDQIISEHDGYKMETIGDAYCVASGIPTASKTDHVKNIATIALLQREFLYGFEIPHRKGQYLHCRWGFNTGSVYTGVVGIRAPKYAVFGATVSIAAKMESSGVPDKIQMTLKSHQLLSSKFPEFKSEARGSVKIDGIGVLLTYWLDGVEELLVSDRSSFQKAMDAMDNISDEVSFQKPKVTISSATNIKPILKNSKQNGIY